MSTLQPRRWQQRNQNHFAKYMQFIYYFKLARAVQQIEHNIYILLSWEEVFIYVTVLN